MVPLRLRSIISTLCATSCVCLCRSSSTEGSIGGISAGRRDDPRPRTTGPEQLGLELILIFCSRFLVMKCVRSPSWLTVPSSSRALEMVALRPSAWPPLAPEPRDPPPYALLIPSRLLLSCIPRTTRSRSGAECTRTSAITCAARCHASASDTTGAGPEPGGGAGTRGGACSGGVEEEEGASSSDAVLLGGSVGGASEVGGFSVVVSFTG
ncbi:hypothetical protein AMEX_G15912 [Astyanax mexicanus]|uniref:Secreted protein n=1 Tax=Astyanax mexicanus TaxID=7994 RepID=A0A8T2LGL7_ASTMX|nr:hypothetical protein AMEX_G15912 [Astyanax mexicanus]